MKICARVLDADRYRRSANGGPAAPCADRAMHCVELLFGDVVEEVRRMRNGRPASATSTSPLLADRRRLLPEQAGDMRRDRPAPRSSPPRAPPGMRCAAASTAAPPRLWPIRIAGALMRLAQMVGGGDQIVDVRGERRVGELAFAGAEAGEIEAQHRDAARLQPVGDAPGRPVVLAAGEAVRKQRDRANSPSGRSSRAASFWPSALRKSKRSAGMNISARKLRTTAFCA